MLSEAERAYTKGTSMIEPWMGFQTARMDTDRKYATQGLEEEMAGRGIYNSSIRPYLQKRDIDVPYGRGQQDLAMSAAQQYADLASELGGANLGYNQTLMEELLNRAAQMAAEMPMSLPQSGYELPEQAPSRLDQGPRQDRRRRGKRGKKGKR